MQRKGGETDRRTRAASAAAPGRRKPPRRGLRLRRALLAGALLYLTLAIGSLQLNWARLHEGLGRGARFASGFLHPDFTTRGQDISEGIIESLAITVVATVAGIALSIPLGFGAARNMAPSAVYLTCRAAVTVSRSFHEVIVAIFFVVMVGFGPLAGALTLAFSSIGFLGKLLAEEIEALDAGQIEAVRATGASWPQVVAYGVLPQMMPRLVGLSVYRLDINFRESAVIGVVGAGGIGATLNTAFGRYEFGTAAAILILIVLIVLGGELASGRLRRRLL